MNMWVGVSEPLSFLSAYCKFLPRMLKALGLTLLQL